MHLAMYSIWFGVFLILTCAQLEAYDTFHLEKICKYDEAEVTIPAWGATILKLGHQVVKAYTPAGTWVANKLGDCTVNVETAQGFSLALVVEDMNIRGTKDRTTNKMDCSDYVMFSTAKYKTILNIPTGNLLKSKTKHLCGKTHNAGDNIGKIKLEDISTSYTQGNVFYTENSNIEVVFHQSQRLYKSVNNSFTLILTSYRRTLHACEGRLRCSGSDIYCVNEAFKCDNHINCAFPNNGGDEDPRVCMTEEKSALSTGTTIIIILTCLFGAALLLFCIFVLKSKRKHSTEHSMDDNNSPHAAMRQQSLPMYEAVVSLPAEHSDTVSTGPTPDDPKDVPPSYEQLFPDGPPKQEEGLEESPSTRESAADLASPSGTVGADENAKIPIIGSENIL